MFNTLRLVELHFHLRRPRLLSAESLIKQQQKNAIRKVKSRNCQAKLMCSQKEISNFKIYSTTQANMKVKRKYAILMCHVLLQGILYSLKTLYLLHFAKSC